jgi:sialic acid synthase SpsE
VEGSVAMEIGGREIGAGCTPLVIAEIGINHEGSYAKAVRMIDDARAAGCECVKFQCHVVEDEMIPNEVVPIHTKETIWNIMERCKLTEDEDRRLKAYAEALGMIYLSTPFSRAAADRLERLGVQAFKIGSGECNNYPLVEHIASFGKPIILSTGMNDIAAVERSVAILEKHAIPYALLHCTSLYPTPYEKVRLGALAQLRSAFPRAVIGLSDHSVGNYASFAAAALGASIIEKHFTSDKSWPGPDIALSIDPAELRDLLAGCSAIWKARGGEKTILPEEQPTIDFAYACVVTIRDIDAGEALSGANIWVKRPGTGEIRAAHYPQLLGRRVRKAIKKNQQLRWADLEEPAGIRS